MVPLQETVPATVFAQIVDAEGRVLCAVRSDGSFELLAPPPGPLFVRSTLGRTFAVGWPTGQGIDVEEAGADPVVERIDVRYELPVSLSWGERLLNWLRATDMRSVTLAFYEAGEFPPQQIHSGTLHAELGQIAVTAKFLELRSMDVAVHLIGNGGRPGSIAALSLGRAEVVSGQSGFDELRLVLDGEGAIFGRVDVRGGPLSSPPRVTGRSGGEGRRVVSARASLEGYFFAPLRGAESAVLVAQFGDLSSSERVFRGADSPVVLHLDVGPLPVVKVVDSGDRAVESLALRPNPQAVRGSNEPGAMQRFVDGLVVVPVGTVTAGERWFVTTEEGEAFGYFEPSPLEGIDWLLRIPGAVHRGSLKVVDAFAHGSPAHRISLRLEERDPPPGWPVDYTVYVGGDGALCVEDLPAGAYHYVVNRRNGARIEGRMVVEGPTELVLR